MALFRKVEKASLEIADLHTRVAIRDSKALFLGTLTIPVGSFTALVRSLRATTIREGTAGHGQE
ncbi:DUF397 domain-containing protein [Streptomyces coelicoflavus]|uniref:DUF397 domain-containing protein n=1 Tax=Streptomyces coelicoflavus TaxID=285562 RepID=UPI002E274769